MEDDWQACAILGVADVRAAAAQLERELGFSVRSLHGGEPPENETVYAILERQGTEIHLQIRRRELSASRDAYENDVFVRVADVDPIYDELRRRGATILRPPLDEPYEMRDFVVAGPEGHRFLFGSQIGGAGTSG